MMKSLKEKLYHNKRTIIKIAAMVLCFGLFIGFVAYAGSTDSYTSAELLKNLKTDEGAARQIKDSKQDNNEPAPEPDADVEKSVQEVAEDEPSHTHSYVKMVVTAATCQSAGKNQYTCECGDTYSESVPATEHKWVAQTSTIHHDEVAYMDYVPTGEVRDVYYCQCGSGFGGTEDEWYQHIKNDHDVSDTAHALIIHQPVTIKQWVVETPAYDETVTNGYKCSVCGATKGGSGSSQQNVRPEDLADAVMEH